MIEKIKYSFDCTEIEKHGAIVDKINEIIDWINEHDKPIDPNLPIKQ